MSVRDEIARVTAEAMEAWAAMSRVDEPAQTVERWVADALLPIVERVARKAAYEAMDDRHSEAQESARLDAIVRRVMGNE